MVAAAVVTLSAILNEFGAGVVQVKPLVKVLPKLFDHKDKIVRANVCMNINLGYSVSFGDI